MDKIVKLEDAKINEESLEKVDGGYAGYNKYSKNEYMEAGFTVDWSIFHYDYCALCAGNGFIYDRWMHTDEADVFVDYFKTHTLEEYVQWVRVYFHLGTYVYHRGRDIS